MIRFSTTKKALVSSLVALVICFSMLVGMTFAWFTDSASSTGNVIASGTLEVDLDVLENGTWNSLKESKAALFTEDNWEPGYIDARVLRVENNGSLALKWKAKLVAEKELTILTDVIDVYIRNWGVLADDSAVSYPDRTLAGYDRVGTLREFITDIETTLSGSLYSREATYFGIALKMQESAGNEYQGIDIGGAFDLQIMAGQLAYEEDSFGPEYDEDAIYPVVPAFPVTSIDELRTRLANSRPGDEIYMAAGEYEVNAPISLPTGVTLYGAGAGLPAATWANNPNAEKTVFKSTGTNVIEIRQYTDELELATRDITIDGIMVDCQNNYVNGIYVKKDAGEAMEGIRIVNTAVVNSTNNGMYLRNTYGVVVEDNYLGNIADSAIVLKGYNGYQDVTWIEVTAYITNNVIENVTASINGAIMLDNGSGDVVVSGNVIRNVTVKGAGGTSSDVKASAIHVYDVYEGGIITITDNTIENAEQGIAIYKYSYSTVYSKDWWEGPTTDNDGVIISNNTITGFKYFGIATNSLNAQQKNGNATTVEITGNTLSSTLSDNALSIDQSGSNWTVTATDNSFNGSPENVNGNFAR